jgi:minimal CRISPR polymerase-like protein
MKKESAIHHYLHADADGIRTRVERLLFNERLEELRDFSARLSASITDTAASLAIQFLGDIIVAGGDDILLEFAPARYQRTAVAKAMKDFGMATGCTLSVGVGTSVFEAYLNLRRAKSEGGGMLIDNQRSEATGD